jgi:hypothetical protein
MTGSIAAGYWIAHGTFWILLVFAWFERGARLAGLFLVFWLIGYAGSGWVEQGAALFVSYTALLDVVLVFLVFRGDVRLAP